MKRINHSLLLTVSTFLLLFSVGRVQAQCGIESRGNVPFFIPPAFTAQNGVQETFAPAKIYLGKRDGSIEEWTFDSPNQSVNYKQALTPGDQIPSEVTSIIYLSIPSRGTVVGLVIYDDGGTLRYGVLRSTDDGASWNLLKPSSVTGIDVIEDDGNRLRGNYYRAPLLEIKWLEDGMHGWLWGRRAVLKTTDAGVTWSQIFSATADTRVSDPRDSAYDAIWGVAFESLQSGVVAHGSKINVKIKHTSDGGDSWTFTTSMNPRFIVNLDWTGFEYRVLRADPFNFGGNNLDVLTNATGVSEWLKPGQGPPVNTNAELMTEWIWPAHNVGFLVHRQGEIWKTEDGGKTWVSEQENDPSYPPVEIGDGFPNDRGSPQVGYGQKSIFIQDEFGAYYIIHVLTDTCSGVVRNGRIYAWRIGQFVGVDDVERRAMLELNLSPNPVTENLELRFTLENRAQIVVNIVDARGIVAESVDFGMVEPGDQMKTFNIGNLPSGFYRVVVRSGTDRRIEAIVVMR